MYIIKTKIHYCVGWQLKCRTFYASFKRLRNSPGELENWLENEIFFIGAVWVLCGGRYNIKSSMLVVLFSIKIKTIIYE